jgi:hypothetical protein
MKKRQQRRSPEPFVEPPLSPFAPWEYHRLVTTVFGLFGLFGLIKSGIHPGPDDPQAWYDRAIRVAGGLILIVVGSVFIAMLVETVLRR